MNENSKKQNNFDEMMEPTIDLAHIIRVLWDHIIVILLTGALFAAALFFYARVFVTPRYEANALFYVNNSSISLSSAVSISSGELNAASELVDTYVAILQSRANMEQVIAESGVDYSYEQLRRMVSATAVNSTGLFRITVNSANPEEARTLANTIAVILPEKISDIVANSSVVVVDYAVTPRSRVSPNYIRYAEIGFLLGVLLSGAIVFLIDFLDTVIHDQDYLIKHYQAPVLATIPDLTAKPTRKYGYGYGYGYDTSYAKAKGRDREKSNEKR